MKDHFNYLTIKWALCSVFSNIFTYPLDGLKTRSQVDITDRFFFRVSNMYRGLSYYILQKFLHRTLCYYVWNNVYQNSNSKHINIFDSVKASVVTGVFTSIATINLDYKKINNQTTTISRKISFPKFSFKIYSIVFTRDVLQLQFYFPVYLLLKNNTDINSFLIGGFCGALSNLIVYPIDTIKTLAQKNSIFYIKNLKFGKNLYSGIKFSTAKSFITHGLTFFIFEKMK